MSKFKNFCTVFDFDFRFKKKNPVTDDTLMVMTETMIDITQKVTGKMVEILVTRKQKDCYKKVDGVEECWASGCHMYILKHRFTQGECLEIRRLMLKDIDPGLNYKGVEDIIDLSVFPLGKNGVYLISSPKPGCPYKLSHRPLFLADGVDIAV